MTICKSGHGCESDLKMPDKMFAVKHWLIRDNDDNAGKSRKGGDGMVKRSSYVSASPSHLHPWLKNDRDVKAGKDE